MDNEPKDFKPEIPFIPNNIGESVINIINVSGPEERNLAIESFIERRKAELKKSTISHFSTGDSTSDFIPEKTIIMPSRLHVTGYVFDDDDIYKEVFNILRSNKDFVTLQNLDSSILTGVIYLGMINYFGDIAIHNQDTQLKHRERILAQNSDLDENKAASVKDFKSQNVAVCVDRAVFGHNCFLMFGAKDTVHLQNGNLLDQDILTPQLVPHGFNIIENGDKKFLVDFSLVNKSVKSNGKVELYPQKLPISSEQLQDFQNKKIISFDYINMGKQADGTFKKEPSGKKLYYSLSGLFQF